MVTFHHEIANISFVLRLRTSSEIVPREKNIVCVSVDHWWEKRPVIEAKPEARLSAVTGAWPRFGGEVILSDYKKLSENQENTSILNRAFCQTHDFGVPSARRVALAGLVRASSKPEVIASTFTIYNTNTTDGLKHLGLAPNFP